MKIKHVLLTINIIISSRTFQFEKSSGKTFERLLKRWEIFVFNEKCVFIHTHIQTHTHTYIYNIIIPRRSYLVKKDN